ncbi:MAG TPA: hypothetical protein VHJ69_06820 [Gemmatimonadales bacterium]|nr:hypothetical protein [Gemmatimonadales bacterium]
MNDAKRRALRREVAVLVGLVIAVDAVAIALWLFTDLRHAGVRIQFLFTVAWTVATLAVVIVSLGKIRLLRRR